MAQAPKKMSKSRGNLIACMFAVFTCGAVLGLIVAAFSFISPLPWHATFSFPLVGLAFFTPWVCFARICWRDYEKSLASEKELINHV